MTETKLIYSYDTNYDQGESEDSQELETEIEKNKIKLWLYELIDDHEDA